MNYEAGAEGGKACVWQGGQMPVAVNKGGAVRLGRGDDNRAGDVSRRRRN